LQQTFPFQPRASNQNPPAGTVNGAVTGSVTQLTLGVENSAAEASVRLVNVGSQTIFWAYGTEAGLTVANGVPMLPNTVEVFMLPPNTQTISVIAAATGSTLYATVGDGI
jgi:hypothetical protein